MSFCWSRGNYRFCLSFCLVGESINRNWFEISFKALNLRILKWSSLSCQSQIGCGNKRSEISILRHQICRIIIFLSQIVFIRIFWAWNWLPFLAFSGISQLLELLLQSHHKLSYGDVFDISGWFKWSEQLDYLSECVLLSLDVLLLFLF